MNQPFCLMLVGEDQQLSKFLKNYLQRHGYKTTAELHKKSVPAIDCERPHLVILDPSPSTTDSEALYQDIRATYQGPVILLADRENGQPTGSKTALLADGYVNKPIEPQTLLAKIRTLLKRFHGDRCHKRVPDLQQRPVMNFGELLISTPSRKVVYQKEAINLSCTEFDLLTLLAGHAGKVLDRDTINRRLRGIPYDGLDRSVDVAVSRLRKKLGDSAATPCRIKTVWGKGYLFVPDAWD